MAGDSRPRGRRDSPEPESYANSGHRDALGLRRPTGSKFRMIGGPPIKNLVFIYAKITEGGTVAVRPKISGVVAAPNICSHAPLIRRVCALLKKCRDDSQKSATSLGE